MPGRSEVDVVVVGGGHNGLVAAGYLAKAGARTLVLEQRGIVGGACVTEEPWPGFKISTFSYAAGLLRPQIVSDLELPRFGYQTFLLDPEMFVPLPGGRSLTLWNDDDRSAREIARFSARDASAYPRYSQYWTEVIELLDPLLLSAPVPLPELLEFVPDDRVEALVRDLFLRSAADMLDEWFESEELKGALCTSAIIGTFLPPDAPGTAYVLAHHKLGNIEGHAKSWGLARGGMGGITQALRRAAEHFGATVRTDARVQQVLVRDGRAVGVVLQGGERVEARVVASTIDARHTFLQLLPPEALNPEFRRQVGSIRSRGSALKFNAALDGLPDFTAAPGVPGPHHRGFVDLIPNMDYARAAFDDAWHGRFSRRPFMDIVFQSAVDDSVAPPGKHTMSCFVQYAPTELTGTTWDAAKPDVANTVLDTIEEYAPKIRTVVRHWQVISPADIESTLGMTGGNIFQGDITPDQIFTFRPVLGWSQYRTPVKGLYLAGSAAHPGGGVLGAPGHNAARAILEDLALAGRA
ncbi:MAG: NAD(P)/FAD-dependent oxidoreductase [Thermoplasmata archaeon]|nr:NAD(P)/FAD-dependent oxidoreductase [Thermoplasmata archaeon]